MATVEFQEHENQLYAHFCTPSGQRMSHAFPINTDPTGQRQIVIRDHYASCWLFESLSPARCQTDLHTWIDHGVAYVPLSDFLPTG